MGFKFKILTLFFAVAGISVAQTNTMNLNQCLNYGLEHSPYVTLSNNELKMFEYDKRDLYASYLPSLNASGGLDYNAKLPVTVIPAGSLSPQELRIEMGSKHTNNVAVQLEQKIYDQAAIIGISGTRKYQTLSTLNAEKTIEDLMYDIASAYYQVLVVNQQVDLLESNKNKYEELKKIMALQLEKGVIKQLDYNRIKVAYNNITSQLSVIKTARENAINYLKVTIGMPLETDLQIDKDKKLIESVSLPEDDQVDISNRLEFKIQQQTIALQELNSKVTKYSFLPTLSGYARYGANSYAQTFNDSWKSFNDFATIGLKLNIPIFNGLQVHNNYQKQLINVNNLKTQSEIMEKGFKVELLNARAKLIEAHTSYIMNLENIELAEDVYETTNLSYQKGAVSLSDFLNADFSYKEAQTNYLTSLVNMLSSRLDYEKSRGNLTNYLNNK